MHSLLYNHLIKCKSGLNFFTRKHVGTKEFWTDACTVWVWLMWPRCTSNDFQSTFEATPPVSPDGRYYIHGHSSLKNKNITSKLYIFGIRDCRATFWYAFLYFSTNFRQKLCGKTIFYHDKRNHFPHIIKKNIWE